MVIYWFRRDLRLVDNTALSNALNSGKPVLGIFIFDEKILNKLSGNDSRVNFIYDQLKKLNNALLPYESGIKIYKGKVESIWKEIIATYNISSYIF